MLAPCRDCAQSGRCKDQAEVSRLALFAWAKGGLISCNDRVERWWRGIEGVKA